MKLNKHIQSLCVLCVFAVIILSCKKEQPAMRSLEEDCECAKEVSADFLMEEMTTGNTFDAKYTNTDTIFRNKNVRFTALENDADYTWYVGAEVIKEKTFTRFFSSSLSGQELPITLVVKKKANTICLPNDDGYDSITKKIIVINHYPIFDYRNLDVNLGLVEGTFRVKSQNLADSFDITIDYVLNGLSQEYVNIYNYNGLGSDCILNVHPNLKITGNCFYTSDVVCDNLWGDIHYRMDNVVEFTFILG
jgi:hypothetical protein